MIETINDAPTASAALAPQVTVSAGSQPSFTHLSAAATLTLDGTQMVVPTNNVGQASSALLSLSSEGRLVLSCIVVIMSWTFCLL